MVNKVRVLEGDTPDVIRKRKPFERLQKTSS